jgi:CelD/BcsL family acetyltransferase involved in cellulose biosynthesis
VTTESRRRELLPVLFELHRKRWSERGGSDGLFGPGLPEFHEEASRLALERGWLRLCVLWLGETPAAALYGFRYGAVFSFYQCGFDPRFAKLGVGLVALGLAIRSAVLEGAGEFDLLHGEEPYKFHWAKRTRALVGCRRSRGARWGACPGARRARSMRRGRSCAGCRPWKGSMLRRLARSAIAHGLAGTARSDRASDEPLILGYHRVLRARAEARACRG